MISIGGVFVKLLLLLPLILCAEGKSKKLSVEKNEKVQEQCGKFKNLKDVVHTKKFAEKEHLISWISSHHFLADASILPKDFDEKSCIDNKKKFPRNLKGTTLHGLFLGDCNDVGVGMVLMESPEIAKHWLCIQNETSKIGHNVEIVENSESIHQATVIECNQNSPTTFCLKSDKGIRGHVIFGSEESWAIGGYVINADNKKQIGAWKLDDYREDICKFSGICSDVIIITKNPTTEEITTEATTTEEPETTSPEADTTLTSETSLNPETTPTAETIAIAYADNTTEVSKTAEEQSSEATTEEPKTVQPETTQESSSTEKPTDIPTVPGSDNNRTIPVDQSTEVPSNPTDAPSTDNTVVTQPTIPDVETSEIPKDAVSTVTIPGTSTNHPIGSESQTQPLKTEEIVEEVVDCEEENLCFSEDFFSSSNHFNPLSFISIVLFSIFI